MVSQQSTAGRGKKAVCTRQMGVEPARAHKRGGVPRIVTQFQVTAKEKMRVPGHAAKKPRVGWGLGAANSAPAAMLLDQHQPTLAR